MGSLDAMALVHDPPFVITSPNAPSVPYIDLHEPTALRARADGRFGLEDCFQRPQIWSDRHPWAPCILRKPSTDALATHLLAILWWTPTPKFYELEPGSAFGDLGRLSKRAWEPFKQLQMYLTKRLRVYLEHNTIDPAAHTYEFSMRSTLLRLRDQPLSFRDTVYQVAEFQRLCLDINAMLDYVTIFRPRLSSHEDQPKPSAELHIMGAFTNNPEVTSKLHQCGIPVWLVRTETQVSTSTRIVAKVTYDVIPSDEEVEQRSWSAVHNQLDKPFPTIQIGSGGTARHNASRQMGSAFVDLAPIELPSATNPQIPQQQANTTGRVALPSPSITPISSNLHGTLPSPASSRIPPSAELQSGRILGDAMSWSATAAPQNHSAEDVATILYNSPLDEGLLPAGHQSASRGQPAPTDAALSPVLPEVAPSGGRVTASTSEAPRHAPCKSTSCFVVFSLD
jgi:hypothetical protein